MYIRRCEVLPVCSQMQDHNVELKIDDLVEARVTAAKLVSEVF